MGRKKKDTICLLFTAILICVIIEDAVGCDPIITSLEPHYGSLNGGTRISIKGDCFSENQFSYGTGNEHLGNVVKMVSTNEEFDCQIHRDGTTKVQITCYTVPMPEEDFYIRVTVDGVAVPLNRICGGQLTSYNCRFRPRYSNTPLIQTMPSTSSSPGGLVTMNGKIFTNIYGSNQVVADNGRTVAISRSYVGGELCNLKGENDVFYGLELTNGDWGYLTCKLESKYVGNQNVSFLVSDEFGRSLPKNDLYKIAANGDIYMYQTFAEVSSVTPSSGSVEGGTKVTIAGNYFDNTDAEPVVTVGGVPCSVQSLTINEIVCITGAKQSGSSFYGNRGLVFELWNNTQKTSTNLIEIRDLDSSAADYIQKHAGEGGFTEADMDNYVSKLRGYFVAPFTGNYTFHIKADDNAELYLSTDSDPANMAMVAKSRVATSYTRDAYQSSPKKELTKGNRYYLEVYHREGGGNSFVYLKANIYDSTYSNAMTGNAVQEEQLIDVRSEVKVEKQVLTVSSFTSQTAVSEVQEVTVEDNSVARAGGSFRLGLYGVYTDLIAFNADDTIVQTALNDLPIFEVSESVSVTSATTNNGGTKYTVTFTSPRGDFADIQHLVPQGELTITVAQTTKGVPDGTVLALMYDGQPAPLVTLPLSANTLQTRLGKLFETRCPKSLASPVQGVKHYNFEGANPVKFGGSIVSNMVAFCGKQVVKDPSSLYQKGENEAGIPINSATKLCFAYQGPIDHYIVVQVSYLDANDDEQFSNVNFNNILTQTEKGQWKYVCQDIHTSISSAVSGTFINIRRAYVGRKSSGLFIDNVYFGNKFPSEDYDGLVAGVRTLAPPQPNEALIQSVAVTDTGSGTFELAITPHNCGYNLAVFTKDNGQVPTGGSVSVSQTQQASPPIGGTFTVSFGGRTLTGLTANITDEDFVNELQVIEDIGFVSVERVGDCANFKWKVKFLTNPGDQELLQVDGSGLTGVGVQMSSQETVKGHLQLDPLPGDMLHTVHSKPQAVVIINDIASQCTGNCDYEWLQADTPTVTSLTPTTGPPGTSITISGSGFMANTDNNTVTIGGVACDVTGATTTSITCTIGNGPDGVYKVEVNVDGKGIAAHNGGDKQYVYSLAITGISPTSGSLGGGIPLEVTGYGFKLDATVTVGGVNCPVLSATHANITCQIPAKSTAGAVDVILTQAGNSPVTSSTQFTYDAALTASVTGVSPGTSGVEGGSQVTITGSGFGTNGVLKIGGTTVSDANFTDTEVTAELPALSAGVHTVEVLGSSGAAVESGSNALPTVQYTLKVTNVFPLSGSLMGGTRLTLTGDGFTSDTKVRVGSHECDLDSNNVSPTKIHCTIKDTARIHKVDNTGSHFAFGPLYAWNPSNIEVHTGDIVQWSWDYPAWINNMKPRVEETESPSAKEGKPGGFVSSLEGSKTGSFAHRFTTPGNFYYWSGYVDVYTTTYFHGEVRVIDKPAHEADVVVKIGDFEATYEKPGSDPADSSACSPDNSVIPGCTETPPSGGDASKFNFQFLKCKTPVITSISKSNGTTNDLIDLTGEGFSASGSCQNEVKFGGFSCSVSNPTQNSLSCSMDPNDKPTIGVQHLISLRVSNRGNGLIAIANPQEKRFALLPLVSAIGPSKGSKGGYTPLVITGSGFEGSVPDTDVVVLIGGSLCPIQSFTYTQIVCLTPASLTEGPQSIEVKVGSNSILAECDITCQFVYENAVTPALDSVSPTIINGSSTTLTISGSNFGNLSSVIDVTIGGETCSVDSADHETIECTITNAPAGTHDVLVDISTMGRATTASSVQVQSTPELSTFSPSELSIHGGTKLTLTGNGFKSGQTSVTLGGSACAVLSVTLSQVVCLTSAHAAGSVAISVVSGGVTFPSLNIQYSATASPEITSVTPSSGSAGATITLAGSKFSSTQADNNVTIGGEECTVTSSSTTQIQCTVGNLRAGAYNVLVHVEQKGLSNNDQTYTFEMTATSVSPSSGSVYGGQKITIAGTGFDNLTTITVCGQECVFVSNSVTELVCKTPAASGTVTTTQSCDIVVTNNLLTRTLSGQFSYDNSLTPEITSVNPARGGTGGGDTLTISGSGFGSNNADVTVTIGGVNCVVSTATANQVVCQTEAAPSSMKTKVVLEVGNNGIAKQTGADFHFIDVWSSVYTWGGQSLPTDGDVVVIPAGQTILLDTDTAVLKVLIIQGGELIFDEKDVHLQSEIILITNNGLLQVGTEQQPFQHKATITLHGHLRSKELPVYGTKNIALREGTLDLHGKAVGKTWTHLAATATAGTNQLTLKDTVPWVAGDQIVIASTGGMSSQRENEFHTIQSVSGNTLTLADNLAYTHIGISEVLDGQTFEFRAEVGLLTRNVKVQGSVHEEWNDKIPACPKGFNTGEFATQTCFQGRFGEEIGFDQFGGMIIVHAPEPNKELVTARIAHVELFHVGQAFRLGRYPIHFHLNGDMSNSYVRGCGIHRSFNRAVNIHGTHNTLVENTVIYNTMGGSFFLEDGIETGNTIQNNLGVFVRESSSLQNDDITPAVFWVTNPNNTIRNNAAAGGTHFGFWYRMKEHPEGPSKTNTICPQLVPLGEFEGNSAHSFGWFGLWIFPTYTPKQGGTCGQRTPEPAVFRNFFAWNNEKGAEAVNGGALQFKDFRLINNKLAGYEGKKIIDGEQYTDNSPMVADSFIAGYGNNFPSQGCTTGGIVLAYGFGFQVKNTTFVNFDQSCSVFTFTRITGTCSINCGGFTYVTSELRFVNAPHHGRYAWINEGLIEDLDGTLCGAQNCRVLPKTGTLPQDCTDLSSFSQGIPAVWCPSNYHFHRFAFTNIIPSSLEFKNLIITNSNGNSTLPFRGKAITHKPGWMAILVKGESYSFDFENAPPMTNVSYDGTLYHFGTDDYIFFEQTVTTKPDLFSIDGRGIVNATEGGLDPVTQYHGDWEYDYNTRTVKFLLSGRQFQAAGRRKRAATDILGRSITPTLNLRAIKCFYTNCIVPKDPNSIPPVEESPNDFVFWSNPLSWNHTNNSLPVDGDDVTIPNGVWMKADIALPVINKLVLFGALEFDQGLAAPYKNFTLSATHIIIIGGRLVIGWENRPFLGNIEIILRGSWATAPFTDMTAAPTLGSKVIGVFGGLDLHGKDVGVAWTSLNVTASAGDSTITLMDNVTWSVGEEIVITTSSYNAWETETFKITDISGGVTLTLNGTLRYRHIAHRETIDGREIFMAAKVGLLTRNIRIIGEDYSGLFTESFGARILVTVGQYAGKAYRGFARVANVEFYHTGQEGYTEFYDARYSLTYSSVGDIDNIRPSYVKKSAFHNGFSPAIGVYGSNNLDIEDNIIHHTVWFGMETDSTNTALRRNLFSLMIWEGAYQDRLETTNVRYEGAVNALMSTDLVLKDNVVAGSERFGYHVPPQNCGDTNRYTNNEVVGSLHGIGLLAGDTLKAQGECFEYANFFAWKNRDSGVIYIRDQKFVLRNNILVENSVGNFAHINGPAALSHAFANKTSFAIDNLFVGQTTSFHCTADAFATDDNIQLSSKARSWSNGNHIGLSFAAFMSGGNLSPKKPHFGQKTYPAIRGLFKLEGNTFAHFKQNSCNRRDVAITTNPKNDDGQHPIEMERTTLVNVETESKILFHRPNLGKINSADCVDMDCDGLKKALIKDEDGTFLGSRGAVISQSEFEWDVNPSRGLGDYRIPKVMLTRVDGSRIPVADIAPNKGIIRNSGCTYRSTWQAYECFDLDYEMLIIESMDWDTETRRLSPVAILGDGYVDLINGPQDHGWCSGYTCRKRISTFMAIVATGKDYDMFFTSTSPQRIRYHLLNANESQVISLSLFYAQPNRRDVYVEGDFVMPNNGRMVSNNYILDPPTYQGQFRPNHTSQVAGENYWDRDTHMLYVVIKGDKYIEVITSSTYIISFQFPPLTVDEFYGENLVQYIAAYFDIPPSKVRVVNVVRNTGSGNAQGRRKRSTANDEVVIEIGNAPSSTINGTNADDFSSEQLANATSAILAEVQLGNISAVLNQTVVGVGVAEPLADPSSQEWNNVAQQDNENPYTVVVVADRMAFIPAAVPLHEGVEFSTQPKVRVLDTFGQPITKLGTELYPWQLTASLRAGGPNPNAILKGNLTVTFVDGWANFTNLMITHYGSGYILDFTISYPTEHNLTLESDPITLPARPVKAKVATLGPILKESTLISMKLDLIDGVTDAVIEDIAWRGDTWSVSVELGKSTPYPGDLEGTRTATFDPATSSANFYSLNFTTAGIYVMNMTVTSSGGYEFYLEHKVHIMSQQQLDILNSADKTQEPIVMKFQADYSQVVGSQQYYFEAMMANELSSMFGDVVIENLNITEGSIIVSFNIVGPVLTVNSTLLGLCGSITNNTAFTFNGNTLTLSTYMTVGGSTYYGVTCGEMPKEEEKKKSGMPTATLVAIILAVLAVLLIVVFIIIWKCKTAGARSKGNLSANLYGQDQKTIEDILFREKSFMDIHKSKASRALPPTATNFGYLNDGYEKRPLPIDSYYGKFTNDHRDVPSSFDKKSGELYPKTHPSMLRPPRAVTPDMVSRSESASSGEKKHGFRIPRALTPEMAPHTRQSLDGTSSSRALTPDAISMRGSESGSFVSDGYQMFQAPKAWKK